MYSEKKFSQKIRSFGLFAAIPVFVFVTVVIIPFLLGIFMTITNSTGTDISLEFVGLKNYIDAFKDPGFWDSLILTFKYTFWALLLTNLIAFTLALLVTSGFKGQNFFRMGFFTPNLIGGVILGFIWQFIFSRILVYLGEGLGIELFSGSWLADPKMALWALVIVGIWQNSGYMMLLYIAGLTGIPQSLTEAASLDGANNWQILRKIKLPMMIPSFTISIFLTLQRSFMVYDTNLSLTKGGPYRSTEMISMHVYNDAFLYQNYGTGQAKAIILFVIVAAIALTQVAVMKRKEVEA
ncbi:raffinose/stachyose/melibiose transport system permease protein [Enterococcus sp. PF1-24]|uniref:carbohydrate ABC transporter permease n=1 Tax=unclassified Enterococcus TaxID=2608891 RepID=UPI002475EB7F|nr:MULTISPECIES: sugar ABC transporter permease [unclassified Enterococcus]MDH6363785.1 raffinose/stachyose/melibiose transport system permease protein [Enterococcus sp. PFB1-1]MDH6400741.1 raffinose/stachyose/melibiose transport system permease protein [Enterococcus sp. PF1-24]